MKNFDFSFLVEYKMNDLNMILISFVIGILIASIAMIYHQMFLGGIVRKIIDKKALSPTDAKTLSELGINPKNIFVRFALREKSTFRKVVIKTEGDEKYYIPEERRIREEIRFRKKGNGVFAVVIAALVFVCAAFILLTVIPWLIENSKEIFIKK